MLLNVYSTKRGKNLYYAQHGLISVHGQASITSVAKDNRNVFTTLTQITGLKRSESETHRAANRGCLMAMKADIGTRA